MCLSKRAYSERGPIGQQKRGYLVPFGKESSLSYRLEKACYRKRSAYAGRPETLLFNKAYSFEEDGLPALILISLLCRYSSMNSAVSYSEYSILFCQQSARMVLGFHFLNERSFSFPKSLSQLSRNTPEKEDLFLFWLVSSSKAKSTRLRRLALKVSCLPCPPCQTNLVSYTIR